ncbi:rhodanese-like domain-containing protein [Flavobacterium sp. SUN046]|uniref:rhodanese-like domain-containing protein n=1 Tax=Flavobacterium sp. SUN046 TaxID=3002440 RepID=UPI002DB5ACA0|nr:rhodanese-like domain-containing protein [Flavobacterium sp. SUN046]MEC4049856.1 rhodanese-like domain-containing protein [Flavobacterium sp. SUN046]
MKSKIGAIVSILLLIMGCQKEKSETVQTVDANSFEKKLKESSNPQLLDVRTPEEFATEHLVNATNVDWNGANFETLAQKYDRSKAVFVYCKSGGRSSEAAEALQKMGFKEIYNLDGGIMKWTGEKTTNEAMTPKGISAKDYEALIHSKPKVIVNFYAEWCAPCKKMAPYLLKMQSELKRGTRLERLDADQNKATVDSLKLDGLPVVLIYENGKEVWRNIGFLSEEDLKKHL